MFRDLLHVTLKFMARAVLRKYHPKIIAITGSVGKTSTKEAVFTVLASRFRVMRSEGNYNNEIGLPLAVIGIETGGRSLLRWLAVIVRFTRLMVGEGYPEMLVLEMGADKPGDIKYLTSIAPPDAAIVTRVGATHLEKFGDVETVQQEKSDLIASLPRTGVAILNFDDPRVASMRTLHPGKTVTVGLGEGADIRAENVRIEQSPLMRGLSWAGSLTLHFDIVEGASHQAVAMPGRIGSPLVYALLFAYAAGRNFDVSPKDCVSAIQKVVTGPGRLRPIDGIRGSLLIDDTYNSSPEAVVESLKTLLQIKARRRIAVLGNMLELGGASEREHRRIGNMVHSLNIDFLVAIGGEARYCAEEALAAGMARSRVSIFADNGSASEFLRKKIEFGDVILIKASQGTRLEKIVEAIMANPEQAQKLLVRQSKYWKKK